MNSSIKSIKRRFTGIIICISLLLSVNLFYLTGLYNTFSDETAKMLYLSIEEADGEELQKRMSVKMNDISGTTIAINKSAGAAEDTSANLIVFSEFMNEIKQVVHQALDTVVPPNLPMLDSLIVAKCRQRKISTEIYYSEIIDLKTGGVTASSRATAAKIKDFCMYEYDTQNGYAYKIYTDSLTEIVLWRMSGILLTTFLTILLLGYAFRYFIGTLLKQKTLEEMKQDFTNNMTHELKTPIAVAYSAVDTLLNFRQGENHEKRVEYLNICLEQLNSLRELVEQILSMSMEQIERIVIHRERFTLKPLLDGIAERQKLKTGKRIDIKISVQPENLTVYADMKHFGNMADNLLDNAIKYSRDSIEIQIAAHDDGDFCTISVRDNGVGISVENQKHVFDRFYRVPQGNVHNVKGYGLGLFYVKTMVELHGGRVSVKSELNKGSEFTIKIPSK